MEPISKSTPDFMDVINKLDNITIQLKRIKESSIAKTSLFTMKQVCKMLQISERTLFTLRKDYEISYYKVNGKVLFKYEDIIKVLEDNYFEQIG